MKKILGVIFIFVLFFLTWAWATPPSSINLSYDADKKNLHIEIAHPSHDPHKHHIRKVEVTLNDGKPQELYFASQTSPGFLMTDVIEKDKPINKGQTP